MKKIKIVDIKSQRFPGLLKKIPHPPEKIFFKGNLLPKENCFAIVGTRQCSSYGRRIASQIARDLTEVGWTIVSGIAEGIDACAHQAAVKRGKRTIAVLGTGLDSESFYPQSNLKLAEDILKTGGCLISEYPPGTRGTKYTFPQRNRIISGLCTGVLVVEAKRKSGALITADWAQKQGRRVFAVPGSIFAPESRGCNLLIKNGIKAAENAEDILKIINFPSLEFENQ